MSWAEEEFSTVDFNDKRLDDRLVKVATRLGQSSSSSIPQACNGWQEVKGAYRLFSHEKVTADKILRGHYESTKARIAKEKRVLLLQDTTELNYSNHTKKEGIGPLNNAYRNGVYLHPLLAVTDNRQPLGLVDFYSWSRKSLGQPKANEVRAIEEKETHRWLKHYHKGNQLAEEITTTHFVVIGDRENDIYEVLQSAAEKKHGPTPHADLLVRSSHNRNVLTAKGNKTSLREAVSTSEILGHIQFSHKPRHGKKKRIVKQEVRAIRLTILPTQRRGSRGKMEPFEMTVIHSKEVNPPKGSKGIEWFLLTTVEAAGNYELACQCIEWYLARWDIEIYFHALKNGCRVEEIQLQKANRFYACLALYCVIAWRVVYLTRIARREPQRSCTDFLSKMEWESAYIIIKRKKPKKPPTISEALNYIAQVGGYLARKSDGPPGIKTLWRGLSQIKQVEDYREILNES